MKKIYLSPAIEAVELCFSSVLCASDPANDSLNGGNAGGGIFGGGGSGAPKRPF